MLLQWHITERCDHSCNHCYQNGNVPDLTGVQLSGILEQFRALMASLRSRLTNQHIPAHITITGGEPFLRDDFFDILERFHALRDEFSYAILTSGSRIDAATARRLSTLKPSFVQVSIEGTSKTHDAIRGVGDYEQVIAAIRQLKKAGISVLISFTAHRGNFREFPHVAELGRKLGVTRVWADRFIPLGGAAEQKKMVLSPSETSEFLEIMLRSRKKRRLFSRSDETVTMRRALQFLKGDGCPYRCEAGRKLITVLADGTLVPCRRMPIPAGNLLQHDLVELYGNSPLFAELREERMPIGCESCFYSSDCRGGLRCLAHAMTGSYNRADPGCWLARCDDAAATAVEMLS